MVTGCKHYNCWANSEYNLNVTTDQTQVFYKARFIHKSPLWAIKCVALYSVSHLNFKLVSLSFWPFQSKFTPHVNNTSCLLQAMFVLIKLPFLWDLWVVYCQSSSTGCVLCTVCTNASLMLIPDSKRFEEMIFICLLGYSFSLTFFQIPLTSIAMSLELSFFTPKFWKCNSTCF